MATSYGGHVKWIGSNLGGGTCKIAIDDIDSADWRGTPDTFGLLRTRNTPPSETVTVELVDGPNAQSVATAELFVDVSAKSVIFKGQTPFRDLSR